ncbi:MFS transporter [Sphingomonas fuzhouensis]|uniref:MFS transporter n=1 Tax=Sphingomonas fuzhouensis TaxID=3106033 RepID=UPI002B0013F8|nr:MFS transporter [Sphingomonas sp. SGZ-02]
MGAALRHMLAARARLLPLILAALCGVLVLQSLTSWSASLLIRMHALTPPQAGYRVGIAMMLAGAGGHALGGLLADRRARGGREPAPLLMLIGLALCTLALWPLTRTDSLMVALAALVVAVTGLSIALANGMIGLQARIPPALRVEGTAIFLTIVTLLGTALGPWAVGLASQAIAGPTGLAEAIGRVLGATCLLGCAAAWVAGRRTV